MCRAVTLFKSLKWDEEKEMAMMNKREIKCKTPTCTWNGSLEDFLIHLPECEWKFKKVQEISGDSSRINILTEEEEQNMDPKLKKEILNKIQKSGTLM